MVKGILLSFISVKIRQMQFIYAITANLIYFYIKTVTGLL